LKLRSDLRRRFCREKDWRRKTMTLKKFLSEADFAKYGELRSKYQGPLLKFGRGERDAGRHGGMRGRR
jgi:hypothetical protein